MSVTLVPGHVRPAWCDQCMTSSAVAFDMYAFRPGQTDPGEPVAHAEACQRCDPELFDHARPEPD